MTKRLRIFLFSLFMVMGLVSLGYYFFGISNKTHYTEEIVSKNSDDLKVALKQFLSESKKNANHFKSEFARYSAESFNLKSLNSYFAGELAVNTLVSAIAISGDNKQYIFGKDKDSWVSTFDTNFADTMTTWHRYDQHLNEIGSWSDAYGFVVPLNTINRIKRAKVGESNIWEVIKGQSEERDGVLLNILTIKNNHEEEFILAFVYNLKSLKKRFNTTVGNTNILISFISPDDEIIIPFMDQSQTVDSNGAKLQTKVIDIIDNWRENNNETPQIFSFVFSNRNYWSKIDTLLNSRPVTAFAYTSRQADLVQVEEDKDLQVVYLAVAFFFLAIILGFVFRKEVKDWESKNTIPELSLAGIKEILRKGESGNIEFKSSLRWDYREEKVNPLLENVILKTIAAFTNADGGYLFIGVDDEGNVLGLESDFVTFKKKNLDYFELHIRKIINNQFGIGYSQDMLQFDFPEIDGKNICVITINPAASPQFLNIRDKNGQMTEKFYVRVGNSSQEISSLEEINDYMNRRFPG